MARPKDESLIGRTIAGKFAIESFIGGGAMGQVYKARQVALEKTVALKVLHKDLANDETFATRFHREAKAASRLDHPNSMRVIDFGSDPDGLLYIAMEFLDGRDLLKVMLSEWPLSGPRISGIAMQALAAIAMAHDMGVIHRDLKPENIMVLQGTDDEGRPSDIIKVCDFGIAKMSARASKDTGGVSGARGPSTTQGLVVGTPEYMSPEQGKGEVLDHRSDLYSMGVILFQLLTGRVPFDAESALGIVLKHVTEEPPRPSSINPAVDPRLEAICLKAMKKKREERYQSAREMRADLRAVLEGTSARGVPSDADLPLIPEMASAATLRAAAPFDGDPRSEDGETAPRSQSTATPSGTMALPEVPIDRPRWLPYAAVIAVMTMGGIALGVHLVGAPTAGAERAALTASSIVPPRTPSSESTAPLPPTASPRAAPDPVAIVPATPKISTPPPKHAASPPSTAGSQPLAPTPASSPAATAGSFDPKTASANITVSKATGAAAQDVRAALPSWKYTTCYRDALKAANHRIEGKVILDLTIDAKGAFTRMSASGPQSLLSSVGSCMQDATGASDVPVQNVLSTGAAAEVQVVFVPE